MDLNRPALGGWEATRRLKARPDSRHIPLIALSAHAHARHRNEALAAGCGDFEEKPVDFRSLVGKIEAVLGRRTGS